MKRKLGKILAAIWIALGIYLIARYSTLSPLRSETHIPQGAAYALGLEPGDYCAVKQQSGFAVYQYSGRDWRYVGRMGE